MKALFLALLLTLAPLSAQAATHTVYWQAATGQTLRAYPVSQSLADWATYNVTLTEGSGANVGRYSGTLDDANGTQWVVFVGSTQPASWDLYVASVTLPETVTLSEDDITDIADAISAAGITLSRAGAQMVAAHIVAQRGTFYPNRNSVWVLERTDAGIGVVDDKVLVKRDTEKRKVWIDFAGLLGRNEAIESIDAIAITDATLVADSEDANGGLVSVDVQGGDADDECSLTVSVTTTVGQEFDAEVTLNVVD